MMLDPQLQAEIKAIKDLIDHGQPDEVGRQLAVLEAAILTERQPPAERQEAEAELAILHGRLLYRQERYILAADSFHHALNLLAEVEGRDDLHALANHALSIIARRQQRDSEADHYLDLALAAAEADDNPRRLANMLNSLANRQGDRGEYAVALATYERALQIAQAASPDAGHIETTIQNNLAEAYCRLGNLGQALAHAEQTLVQAEQDGDKQVLTWVLNKLGRIHAHAGNFAAAEEVLLRQLRIAEAEGQRGWLCQASLDLAGLAWLREQFSAAKQYARRVINYSTYQRATLPEAHAILAHCAIVEGEITVAYRHYQQMANELRLHHHTVSSRTEPLVLTALALYCAAKGNWQRAGEEFDTALSRIDALADPYAQAQVRFIYAKAIIKHQHGARQLAQQLLIEAQLRFEQIGAVAINTQINSLLVALHANSAAA